MGDSNVWGDSEYGIPDPEYGVVFRDTSELREISDKELAERRRWREKLDREREVSRNFNSYMIQLTHLKGAYR